MDSLSSKIKQSAINKSLSTKTCTEFVNKKYTAIFNDFIKTVHSISDKEKDIIEKTKEEWERLENEAICKDIDWTQYASSQQPPYPYQPYKYNPSITSSGITIPSIINTSNSINIPSSEDLAYNNAKNIIGIENLLRKIIKEYISNGKKFEALTITLQELKD